MIYKILVVWAGLIAGVLLGIFLIQKVNIPALSLKSNVNQTANSQKKVVIGFLPFWLIDKAASDYSPFITQLSYFNLVIDSDGTIQKYTAPGQSDPGYHALFSGKVDDFLVQQKAKGIDLSLTVFSGDDKKITKFLEDPTASAQNLVSEISPLITQYGFADLNLDIEMVSDASSTDRANYYSFVKEVRNSLNKNISLTLDCPPISFVRDKNLCDPVQLSTTVDYIVLMDYDFHSPSSSVTGPVSPQSGAGIISEFDTESAVQAALTGIPASKLVLAVPLYGYSWETINPFPRAAVMPGSAYSISSKSVDELLAECATCSAEFDATDSESHIIYKDADSGLFHQIFYPDQKSTQIKIDFTKRHNLGGMALWALGYEDSTILEPFAGMGVSK